MYTDDVMRNRAFKDFIPHYVRAVTGASTEYFGWQDEQLSWKSTCYVGDWSFVPQIAIKGPDVERLFSHLSVNRIADMPIGRTV